MRYSKEIALIEAKKYSTKNEFIKADRGTYRFLKREGLLEDAIIHMKCGYEKYSIDEIYLEAEKYSSRSEFRSNSKGHYESACRRGILSDVVKNIPIQGSRYRRKIYACVFDDGHAYVGLTYNIAKRISARKRNTKDSVTEHSIKNSISYRVVELTGFVDKDLASELETVWFNEFKSNGFKMLNKVGTGNLGSVSKSPSKWTKEKCIEVAKTCNSFSEFRSKFGGARNSARRYGFIDEIRKIYN